MAGRPGSISHGEAGTPGASFWPALRPPSSLPSSPSGLPKDASSRLSQWMLSALPSCSHKRVLKLVGKELGRKRKEQNAVAVLDRCRI